MGQINFKSNITLLSPSQLLHELFGEFLSIGSSPCLVRLQLPPPSPGRDSNTITRPLGKPWCSRSLRSPCKFCQVGGQPLWGTSRLCLHCILCTRFTEHLLSHGDVADVPEGSLALRADKAFCMSRPTWKECNMGSFSDPLLVLSIKTKM